MSRPDFYESCFKFNDWYKIDDTGEIRGCEKIKKQDAKFWNDQNFGIFWTVNHFAGKPRQKQNLVDICGWHIELDQVATYESLMKDFVEPSMVIQSKRGYHVYYQCSPCVELKSYAPIQEKLVKCFGGDENAKDVCRILRVPGYQHCKDKKDKFRIKLLHRSSVSYSPEYMLNNLKSIKPAKIIRAKEAASIYDGDQKVLLEKLSGKEIVFGDTYSFKENANGTLQIYVNDQSTACWIDANGKIGSHEGGGPTVFQWVNWYYKNKKLTFKKLMEVLK